MLFKSTGAVRSAIKWRVGALENARCLQAANCFSDRPAAAASAVKPSKPKAKGPQLNIEMIILSTTPIRLESDLIYKELTPFLFLKFAKMKNKHPRL